MFFSHLAYPCTPFFLMAWRSHTNSVIPLKNLSKSPKICGDDKNHQHNKIIHYDKIHRHKQDGKKFTTSSSSANKMAKNLRLKVL